MRVNRFLKPGLWLALALPAFGQFTPIATPTAGYTGSTTLIPISVADFTLLNSISGGGQTVSFSTPMQARTVPTNWTTWGAPPATESATPRVLATDVTSATLTLSTPAGKFGFEIEPLNPGTYPFTITFMNGVTVLGTLTPSISGTSGAILTAASSSTPITSVTISAGGSAGGFAIAQLRFAIPTVTSVPAAGPTALAGLAMALLAAGALLARKQALTL